MMITHQQAWKGIVAALMCAFALGVHAQSDWPNRPVRIVVPLPAGGGIDIAARLFAEKFRERWNQNVLVDNKPGANTLIGVEAFLAAPRDGYTLLVTNTMSFTLPYVNDSVKVRPLNDLVSVGQLTVDHLVLVTRSDVPGSSLAEVLAYAKRDPKNFAFGSYGYGTTAHLLLLEINKTRHLDLTHVPYKGTAPMVQAMLSGDIKLGLSNYGTVRPFVEAGKLKLLAVTGDSRSAFMSNVPTLSEAGIANFESAQWVGLFAGTGVPEDVLRKVARDVQEIVKDKSLIARLAATFQEPGASVAAEFGRIVARDTMQLGKMSQAANIKMQ